MFRQILKFLFKLRVISTNFTLWSRKTCNSNCRLETFHFQKMFMVMKEYACHSSSNYLKTKTDMVLVLHGVMNPLDPILNKTDFCLSNVYAEQHPCRQFITLPNSVYEQHTTSVVLHPCTVCHILFCPLHFMFSDNGRPS